MRIVGIIWLRNVIDKPAWKHKVTTDEVEEVLNGSPRYRFIDKGDVEDEHLYTAMGRTKAGRYLIGLLYSQDYRRSISDQRERYDQE